LFPASVPVSEHFHTVIPFRDPAPLSVHPQNDVRVADKCAGDCNPLFLAHPTNYGK
jgi:hypothetical protein